MFVVGALTLQVASPMVTIYLATTNPSYAVEDDYYQKAQRWDETRAQEKRNTELGWTFAFEVEPPTAMGDQAAISVKIVDIHGDPITGATIDVETFHNARANDVLRTTFAARDNGEYRVSLPMRRTGVWEFRYTVTYGTELFTHTEVRHVVLGGR